MGGFDFGRVREAIGVHAASVVGDAGRETGLLVVCKYDLDQTRWALRKLGLRPGASLTSVMFDRLKIKPGEVAVCPGNMMVSEGYGQLFKSILGGSPTLFSASVGRIGVGTGTGAATWGDTALGSITSMTGNNWILCGAGPTDQVASSPATSIFTASFGPTAAVGTWNEWAIDQGTASGGPVTTRVAPMINHAVPGAGGPGTKGAATWTATATLSFT